MIEQDPLLRVQYNWVIDILKRMELIISGDYEDVEKVQQLTYLIKQALKAEKPNHD